MDYINMLNNRLLSINASVKQLTAYLDTAAVQSNGDVTAQVNELSKQALILANTLTETINMHPRGVASLSLQRFIKSLLLEVDTFNQTIKKIFK